MYIRTCDCGDGGGVFLGFVSGGRPRERRT